MAAAPEALCAAAKQLPADERLALVEQILDSLDAADSSIDAQWVVEAQSRLAAYRRGELEAVPLADVLAKYRAS